MLDASARLGILKPIRLVIVDPQPIVLQGLRSILATQQDFDVVASSGHGAACLEALRKLEPDVALIADSLPDLTASEILAIAKAEKLSARLVFFTGAAVAPDVTAAIAAGACSAISKYADPASMLQSLRLMTNSGVLLQQRDLAPLDNEAEAGRIEKMLEQLTQRERQIARLVSQGMSNKEIARQLNVSDGTVKVHLYNIFQKLEITNRTVLATIALLQRTSGFGALALAFIAFALADELKASEANETVSHGDGDGTGHASEHAGYEAWKKAILQHFVVSSSGETLPHTEKDFFLKAGHVANPAAAMDALRAAEQFLTSKPWKDYSSAGSSQPKIALLLGALDERPARGEPAPDHVLRLASDPMSIHGGYGTFAAVAGALIYALSESEAAAQPHEQVQASVHSVLSGLGETATTKLTAITDDAHHVNNSAPDIPSHDFGRPAAIPTKDSGAAADSQWGQVPADVAGDGLQNTAGLLDQGHVPGLAGQSRDQLVNGNFDNVVDRSTIGANSAASDTVPEFASGPGRLNLAAFGALAWLHITAAAKSIPPHTLAWVYDPITNETIVYVNATDRVLDIGDRGLMEIHLQGIVSVAESDVVHHPEGGAVAATLEQLEQALTSAVAIDESGLSRDDISESTFGSAGLWSVRADDGWSFQFAQVRTGSGTSAKSRAATGDAPDTTEESAGASGISAHGSSTAPGQNAAVPVVEKLTWSAPANASAGAPSKQQNENIPTTDGTSPGNSQHASEPDSTKASQDSNEPGNGGVKGAEQAPAPKAAKGPVAENAQEPAGHGHSGHDQDPGAANAAAAASSVDRANGHHGDHASKPGPEKADIGSHQPGAGIGKDAGHQAPSMTAEQSAAEKTSKPVKHGGPGHDQHTAPESAPAADAAADSGGDSQSRHAAKQGEATAAGESGHAQSQLDLHVPGEGAAAGNQQAKHDTTEHEANRGQSHRDLDASEDRAATAEQGIRGDVPGGQANSGQSQRDGAHSEPSQKAGGNDQAIDKPGPAQTAAAPAHEDAFHFKNDMAAAKGSDDFFEHGPAHATSGHGPHNAVNNGLALIQAEDLSGPSLAEQSTIDHARGVEHHPTHDLLV